MDKIDYSVNTRPLLGGIDSEDEDQNEENSIKDQDDHIVVGDTRPLVKLYEPADKYFIAYIIFYLLGMTTLLPWNFFITANDYWMYKFRDPKSNDSFTYHSTASKTPLQAEFTSYISIASAVPNTIVLIMNTYINQRISLGKRMYFSLCAIIFLFIVTTVLVQADTDSWEQQFFLLTIVTVIIANVASAVLSGSIFGIIGNFSPRYVTAVIGGQALGGIFASLTQIGTLALGASSIHSGFVYFMIGNVVLILALLSYCFLSKSLFFNYRMSHGKSHSVPSDLFPINSVQTADIDNTAVLRKIWMYGIAELLVMMITLAVYPGVTVLVESQGKGKGRPWNDVYFVPVVTYLIFNCGDYTGRLLAGTFQSPRDKPRLVLILSILRVVFIPLLMLCNEQPRHYLPVLISADYYYILIMVLFAMSNGCVEPSEKETASSMMAAFLGVGLAFGSAICFLLVKLL